MTTKPAEVKARVLQRWGLLHWTVPVFGLSALAAVVLGFCLFSARTLAQTLTSYGYYFILTLVVLFCVGLRRLWLEHGGFACLPRDYRTWGAVALATLTVWLAEPWQHKILFDEYSVSATSLNMFMEHEAFMPSGLHQVQGTYYLLDGYLDKRPMLYPFLVSLLHTFTGYRESNTLLLNVLLVPVFFLLLHAYCAKRWGRLAAFVALALVATLPLFSQLATCGAIDFLNLFLLLLLLHAAALYHDKPSLSRQAHLVLCLALVSQARYESLVFVLPVGLCLLAAAIKQGRLQLGWALLLVPLLLVPAAWLHRYIDANPVLWELKPGQTLRFSLSYLAENGEGALRFFFNTGPRLPNSPLITWGALAVCASWSWTLLRKGAKFRSFLGHWLPELCLGLTVSLLFCLYLFYYWSCLTEAIATRLALPFYLFLALLICAAVPRLEHRFSRLGAGLAAVFVVYLAGFYLPCVHLNSQVRGNLGSEEVRYWVSFVRGLPEARRLCVSYNQLPLVTQRQACLTFRRYREREAEVAYHLRQGTYTEIVVVELLSPTSPEGLFAPLEDFRPPENCLGEVLSMKRIGGRLIRISRYWSPVPPHPSQVPVS